MTDVEIGDHELVCAGSAPVEVETGEVQHALEEIAPPIGAVALQEPVDFEDSPVTAPTNGNGKKRTTKNHKRSFEGNDGAANGIDLVKRYLNDLGKYPLLTAQQEVELASRIKKSVDAQTRLESGEVISPTTRRELRRAIRSGEDATRTFINSNLRLVVSIAKRYEGSGLELLDRIQEGNLGLMHAVEKFDGEKGFKFSTYATWWIRQAVTRAIADKSRTIRIPAHLHETLISIEKAQKAFVIENGEEPTVEELAELTPFSEKKIREAFEHVRVADSLNREVGEDGDGLELEGLIADETTSGFDEQTISNVDRSKLVDELLDGLNDREREIVKLRFGLDGYDPHTLEEVGRRYNLTRERIRQIESKILRGKLREALALRGTSRLDILEL